MSQPPSAPGPLPCGQDAEELLFHFDQAWRTGSPPRIEDYLTRRNNPGQPTDINLRRFLEDLVKIDLEYRWRFGPGPDGLTDGRGGGPRLEDYARQYPQLGRLADVSLALVGEEYLVRQRWGDRPAQVDYVNRFPGHGAALLPALARIDAEIRADVSGKSMAPPIPAPPVPASKVVEPPVVSAAAFVSALVSGDLLTAAQQQELNGRLVGRFAELRDLARELLRRGWLTAYQVNQLLVGRGQELVLGPFVLLERLGEGGAGQVFKARQRGLERLVALKLIRKNLLADPEVVGRFYREIQVLTSLDHPNVVRGYEAGTAGGTHFLAMEYVEGTDLGRLVKQGGPMPVQQACAYIRQAASGLAHAHERGLVHRDIKPHNLIMSVRDGLLKVADLGLARLPRTMGTDATLSLGTPTTGTLTPENAMLMGTADYLAPEQALDFHAADIRADIYSLGCTLYFLLTGQPPFAGGNLAQKVARHMSAEPPPLTEFRRDLPAGLAAVLRKMLAKRPPDRYQTSGEVTTALAPFAPSVAPTDSAATDQGKASGWRRPLDTRRRAALAIVLVMVLGCVLTWVLTPSGLRKVDEFYLKKQGYLHVVAFSPTGKQAASGGDDRLIVLWDTSIGRPTDRKLFTLSGHKGGVSHLAFSPDGRLLVSGSVEDKVWKLWDLKAQRELASVAVDPRSSFHGSRPFVGPFSPDGKVFAVCHGEGSVSLLDTATREPTARFQQKELPIALAFSPDGRLFVMAAANRIVLCEIATGREVTSTLARGYIWSLAFSPDGNLLAAAKGSNEVHVLDAATLKPRWVGKIDLPRVLPSRTPYVPVVFAPDGKTLACGGWDHQVKLWEPTTGMERGTFAPQEAYTKPVCSLGFAPDSKTLFIAGEDDTIKVWRVR